MMIEKADKKKEGSTKTHAPSFRMEADGGIFGLSVRVYGVFGISELSPTVIRLCLRGGNVEFIGRSLELLIYEGSCAEIKGRIDKVGIESRPSVREAHL